MRSCGISGTGPQDPLDQHGYSSVKSIAGSYATPVIAGVISVKYEGTRVAQASTTNYLTGSNDLHGSPVTERLARLKKLR